jgi:hypothetical protein
MQISRVRMKSQSQLQDGQRLFQILFLTLSQLINISAAKIEVGYANPDDMVTYLNDPILKPADVVEAGGYVNYWTQASKVQPCLGRYGVAYCSAPGMHCYYNYIISHSPNASAYIKICPQTRSSTLFSLFAQLIQ